MSRGERKKNGRGDRSRGMRWRGRDREVWRRKVRE